MAEKSESSQSSGDEPRSRRRRWIVRILIGLGVLLVIVAIVAQIVLSTSIPRKIVLSIVQSELGLRMTAASLSTGWLGHTELTDVTLALPLQDDSFLKVPSLKVSHTSMFGLIIGRSLKVEQIVISKPSVVVRQDEAGRWNLQEVIELLGKAGGAKSVAEQAASSRPEMPKVRIDSGVIRIIDNQGREATLAPLNVQSGPRSPLVWAYEVKIGEQVAADGELVPGGSWKHRVSFAVDDLGPWSRAWIQNWPEVASIEGDWQGQTGEKGITGRLNVHSLQVMQYSAEGVASIEAGGGSAIIRPENFVLHTAKQLPEIRLLAGELQVDGTGAKVKDVRVVTGGGQANLSGRYGFSDGNAVAKLVWRDVAVPVGTVHGGQIDASVRQPWPGQPLIQATLSSYGHTDAGKWAAGLVVEGQGRSWNTIDWNAKLPRIHYEGARDVTLNDVSVEVATTPDEVRLVSLGMAEKGTLSGNGLYKLGSGEWYLWAQGSDWRLPGLGDAPLGVMINIWGGAEQIRLDKLFVSLEALDLFADGYYYFDRPKPVDLNLYLTHPPANATDGPPDALLRGRVRADAHVSGTVRPMNLDLDGQMRGREVFVRGREVGQVQGALRGAVRGEDIRIDIPKAELFKGIWDLSVRYPLTGPRGREVFLVDLGADRVALSEVGTLLNQPQLTGMFSGKWRTTIPRQGGVNAIESSGDFTVDKPALGAAGARKITGKTKIFGGTIEVADGLAVQGDGSAKFTLKTLFDHLDRLNATLDAADWPLAAAGGELKIISNLQTQVFIDTSARSIQGPVTLRSDVVVRDRPAAKIAVNGQLHGRSLELTQIHADAAGGEVNGVARVDFDKPLSSTAELDWADVRAGELIAVVPELSGLEGTYSGKLSVARAPDPRAPEPLRVKIDLHSDAGRFRSVSIGEMMFASYLNILPGFKLDRAVLDRSDIELAGGVAHLWARAGTHPAPKPAVGPAAGLPGESGRDTSLAVQVICDFDSLSLDQLVKVGKPEATDTPGQLEGRITVVGNPSDPATLFGEGNVKLTHSDLGDVAPIAALYNAMNLGASTTEPAGRGMGAFRIEASTLNLTSLRYFNRGVEAKATATVHDLWNLPASRLEGFAVGTIRPLKNSGIGFITDADAILGALQQNLTTVRFWGTVKNPEAAIVPFNEIGGTLRTLLIGDVQSQTGGSAGQ